MTRNLIQTNKNCAPILAQELIQKGSQDLERIASIWTQLEIRESKRFDSGIPTGYRGWIPGFATEKWINNTVSRKRYKDE